MTGDCASCGFPILLRGQGSVACPFCATVNEPADSLTPLLAGLFLVGLLMLAKSKVK